MLNCWCKQRKKKLVQMPADLLYHKIRIQTKNQSVLLVHDGDRWYNKLLQRKSMITEWNKTNRNTFSPWTRKEEHMIYIIAKRVMVWIKRYYTVYSWNKRHRLYCFRLAAKWHCVCVHTFTFAIKFRQFNCKEQLSLFAFFLQLPFRFVLIRLCRRLLYKLHVICIEHMNWMRYEEKKLWFNFAVGNECCCIYWTPIDQ